MAVTKTNHMGYPTLKIWSLETYKILQAFEHQKAKTVQEIRFSEGLVMTISKIEDKRVSFEIYNPVTQQMLRQVLIKYDFNKKLSCIEFFSSSLVFKLKEENASIVDLIDGSKYSAPDTQNFEP